MLTLLKAIIPGGSSSKVLRADETYKLKDGREIGIMDIPMDFDTMAQCGTMAGSGGVIIMDDSRSMTWVINNLNKFYQHESCGQCTPCRNGTAKASALIAKPTWDVDLLADLSAVMRDASICGLGQAAPNPVDCVVKYFPQELA